MRRGIGLALATLVGVLVVSGCGAAAAPQWTYDPNIGAAPTPGGPVASGSAESPAASAVPSSGPAGTQPAASGGATLQISAHNIAFDQQSYTTTANVPLTIHFDNEDSGTPHDVAIYQGSTTGTAIFTGNTITGVSSTDYAAPALAPGTYTIICTIHPTLMIATLTVK